jgi:hypothetical protein
MGFLNNEGLIRVKKHIQGLLNKKADKSNSFGGFEGGEGALSTTNAIQLGEGVNSATKSLKVYDKQVMNSMGYIPMARYARFVRDTTSRNLTAGGRVTIEVGNVGESIIIPVVRTNLGYLVASSVYSDSDGKQYITITGLSSSSSLTDFYVDYWILSET